MKVRRLASLVRPLAYPALDAALRAYGRARARTYDPRSTIFIASSGRGGSTWLAGLVADLTGRILIWEPLHLAKNPRCREFGFTWQNYVPADTSDPRKEAYLDALVRGEDLSVRTTSRLHFRVRPFLRFRGYVVKCVNSNMLLPWLSQRLDVRYVLLVRHPCAVVASQIESRAWSHVTKSNLTVPKALLERHPHLAEVLARLERPEQLLAFAWALQTFVPLTHPSPSWTVVAYEHLLTRGNDELGRLFRQLGEPLPRRAADQLGVASGTVSPTFSPPDAEGSRRQLEGWRRKLTPRQIDDVLGVTHAAGLACYTDQLLPRDVLTADAPA